MARRATKTDVPPEGLAYFPEALSVQEEQSLVDSISGLAFREVRMHGVVARQWQHSIPAAKNLRYSIAFRTVREKVAGSARLGEPPAVGLS